MDDRYDDPIAETEDGRPCVTILMYDNRDIVFSYTPVKYKINLIFDTDKANGTGDEGLREVGLGDELWIVFKPDSGYLISSWTINGDTVNNKSNEVLLKIDRDWLNDFTQHETEDLIIIVTTVFNPMFIGLVGLGIALIPVSIVVAIFMHNIAKKRREELAKIRKVQEQNRKMIGFADQMKSIHDMKE